MWKFGHLKCLYYFMFQHSLVTVQLRWNLFHGTQEMCVQGVYLLLRTPVVLKHTDTDSSPVQRKSFTPRVSEPYLGPTVGLQFSIL